MKEQTTSFKVFLVFLFQFKTSYLQLILSNPEMINVISFRDCVSMYDNARLYVANDVITWLDRFGKQNFLSPDLNLPIFRAF